MIKQYIIFAKRSKPKAFYNRAKGTAFVRENLLMGTMGHNDKMGQIVKSIQNNLATELLL